MAKVADIAPPSIPMSATIARATTEDRFGVGTGAVVSSICR
jgi:hypothetical protein